MNPRSTYAFYGSLRRGMSNYHHYSKGLSFLYQEVVPGYQLFGMKYYPYAVFTGNSGDLLTVEVFRIHDPVIEKEIHDLELSVGYCYDEVIVRGEAVGIYLFESAGSEPLVKGGDWVQFFGS